MIDPPHKVPFGYEDVDPEDKPKKVRQLFGSVAPRYDLMNDLMSLGAHRLWKGYTLRRLPLTATTHLLDVAGGTGDLSLAALEKGIASATICDVTPAMLKVAQERLLNKGILHRAHQVLGDAEHLPFASGSFDVSTLAFGLRNLTYPVKALREAHRILKPGGFFACLEFSHPQFPPLKRLYDLYSFSLLPFMGRVVAGDAASYRYLVESIRRFPTQTVLARHMEEAGFSGVHYTNLSGGIVALHTGWHM